jgi:glycosyltransferase involved in cell wall biosynthesis
LLYCIVSRLTLQKGMDLVAGALSKLIEFGGRLAILGSGDVALEGSLKEATVRYPGRVGIATIYDEPLSHLLQAGSDAILIPSRFEPCGLTQLYGLHYGCVPVVARVGGLAQRGLLRAARGLCCCMREANLRRRRLGKRRRAGVDLRVPALRQREPRAVDRRCRCQCGQ